MATKQTIHVVPRITEDPRGAKCTLFVAAVRADGADPTAAARAALATRPPVQRGCMIVAMLPSAEYAVPDAVVRQLEDLLLTTDANSVYFIAPDERNELLDVLCSVGAATRNPVWPLGPHGQLCA